MKIAIAHIRLDGGTQTRAEVNDEHAQDIADGFRRGDTIPPVIVFYDGAAYWLADGFHRVRGAGLAELVEIDADVRQGTRRDAVLFSVGANAKHGLRRTNADKRRAVETLLRDEEWRAWSDREIARRAGVSNNFVSELRRALSSDDSARRKTADGRVMNTANIGRRLPQDTDGGVERPEVARDVDPAEGRRADAPPEVSASPASSAPSRDEEDGHDADVLSAAPPSNVVPIKQPVDTSAFDADVRELRRLLSEARTLSRRLVERGAGLGGVVRAGRVADVRRLVAEALESLGEVKVAV